MPSASALTAISTFKAEPSILEFEPLGNHVMLHATVADRPALLLLDTGAGQSVLDAKWAETLPLRRLGQPVQVTGTGQVSASLAIAPSIRVGGVDLSEPTVVLLSLEDVSQAKGVAIHGVLGFDFLSRFVVEVDYAARTLRLHEPSTYVYRGAGTIVPVSLDLGIPVADVVLHATGQTVAARLILDIGASTVSACLSSALVEAHASAFAGLAGYEAPLGTGVGDQALATFVRLEELRLAGLSFPGPTVGLARARQGVFAMFDGAVGVPVLGQTTLIVDYTRRRVILEPVGPLRPPSHDASGLHLTSSRETDRVLVTHVAAGSPGEGAGIRAGDEIESVDDLVIDAASLDALRVSLRRAGEQRQLVIRRGGKRIEVRIALKEMF
jgi:hypothetical protein